MFTRPSVAGMTVSTDAAVVPICASLVARACRMIEILAREASMANGATSRYDLTAA